MNKFLGYVAEFGIEVVKRLLSMLFFLLLATFFVVLGLLAFLSPGALAWLGKKFSEAVEEVKREQEEDDESK